MKIVKATCVRCGTDMIGDKKMLEYHTWKEHPEMHRKAFDEYYDELPCFVKALYQREFMYFVIEKEMKAIDSREEKLK